MTGKPRQRGQTHGEQLRTQIASILDRWRVDIEQETRLPSNDYIDRFIAETKFVSAIERWAPSLLEEVRGLAEGATQDFKTMLAFQCMDEDWWFRESLLSRAHCSAFGIYGEDHPSLLAQNMDIHTMADGFQMLLHIDYEQFRAYVFSFAGFLGLAGLNSHALGVCVNTLSQLNTSIVGLPVAFIVRSLLEQVNLQDAERFLHSIQHASGQNYMIGDKNEIRDFECSANIVSQFSGHDKRLWHTNHPLVNDDYQPGEKERTGRSFNTDSHRRLDLLKSKLSTGEVNTNTIKETLRTSPICVHPKDNFFTSGSLVMTLSSSPSLEITASPPSQSEYKMFRF